MKGWSLKLPSSKNAQHNRRKIRIGTRGSKLALIQTGLVVAALKKSAPKLLIETEVIKTSGDSFQGDLKKAGGKGLFVKELEWGLLSGAIDVAVHSLKDMPGVLPTGLILAVFPKREDPRDAFISAKYTFLEALPKGALIGTSSPRRADQLKLLRPDCETQLIRGNVETRIQKVETGEFDATLLAVAGLNRLQKSNVIRQIFEIDQMIPAVGQGILGIETRVHEAELISFLRETLEHKMTALQARCERALLAAVGGDCYTSLAGYCSVEKEKLVLIGWLSGVTVKKEGGLEEPEALGQAVAAELLRQTSHPLEMGGEGNPSS